MPLGPDDYWGSEMLSSSLVGGSYSASVGRGRTDSVGPDTSLNQFFASMVRVLCCLVVSVGR